MSDHELRDHFHPDHWNDLMTSGLSPETIQVLGIYSARPGDIPKLIGWAPQAEFSALVFPYPNDSGFCRVKCFPPLMNGNGHTIRYVQRKKSGVHLYIPSLAQTIIKDHASQLAWTEGEKKAAKACQEDIPCIGLGGLWNWIEENEAIAGLDEIAHANRIERFYPDGDVWARPDLLKAVYAFAREIEARGGELQITQLPSSMKLDDYLCQHTRDELEALPTITRHHKTFTGFAKWWRGWYHTKLNGRKPKDVQAELARRLQPYRVHKGRLLYLAEKAGNSQQLQALPIADFAAQITEEITTEEGTRLFTINGTTIHDHEFSLEISASEFSDDHALKSALTVVAGAQAPVHAGMQKHLGPAIQLLTKDDVSQIRRYARTGWADGKFLLPGREPEGVRIVLPRKLPYEKNPNAELSLGLDALKSLLCSMPKDVTTITATVAFQAPLAQIAGWRNDRYALFIKGKTGSFKTSVAQALMSLYGPSFMDDYLLIKFGLGATANAMMQLATHAHDLPFLLDNYKPTTGGGARELINLIHNILEGGEKDRLNRASELKDTKPVFCWPIITGEDVPDTDAAALARMLIVHYAWEPGTPNDSLTKAQKDAPHLSAVGIAWLDWLESDDGQCCVKDHVKHFDDTRQTWATILYKMNPRMANPLRVATNLATHELTWVILTQHPTIGPILTDPIDNFPYHHKNGLLICADTMSRHTEESVEAQRFLVVLRELLGSGRVRLLRKGTSIHPDDKDRTPVVGWKDEDDSVYLLPIVARHAVDQALGGDGLGGVSSLSLYRQLGELKMLASYDRGRETKKLKHDGISENTLHLKSQAFSDEPEGEKEPSGE
jgi:Domain of unknown function (DUF3854)